MTPGFMVVPGEVEVAPVGFFIPEEEMAAL
jgi:hypothetical protein